MCNVCCWKCWSAGIYREKQEISSEQKVFGWKSFVDARGQRRMVRRLWDVKKATVTQTTMGYSQHIQMSISENPEADGQEQ